MRSDCTVAVSSRDGRRCTHRNVDKVLAELTGKQIHRAAEIPVYTFGQGFVEEIAAAVQRRTDATLSVIERELYLDMSGQAFSTAVVEHRFT